MFYLYVLQSILAERHYIGITEDTKNRLREHNNGSVRSTKSYRPWIMVYTEQFEDKTSARKREIYLKRNYKAREEIYNKIQGLIV